MPEAFDTRATLIVAPAGYGKTTLLAQWCERLAQRNVQVACLTASRRERDPTITLDQILLSLELPDLTLMVPINDFERVNEPAIVDLVTQLIDATPSNVHLVLAAPLAPIVVTKE